MNNKENPIITIYTPTYNRAYRLNDLYQSLRRQTDRRFKWLIIDDGSLDNTESLVLTWIDKASFDIAYVKQPNEGKMAKLNYAHQVITTPLCSCVDSDDYLTDNAIEILINHWATLKNDKTIAGIIGLDIYSDNSVVGTKFPIGMRRIKFKDFGKLKIKGDKKHVYRTDIVKKLSYPTINGERFPALGYQYRLIDENYDWAVINEPLCIVEYLEDGITYNKFKQYTTSPHSFCMYRQEVIRTTNNFREKFTNAAHYVSSCIFAKKGFFTSNNYKWLTLIALPAGILLNIYLRSSGRSRWKKIKKRKHL